MFVKCEMTMCCDTHGGWYGRLMFGTDLPVWQAHEDDGLTEWYWEYVRAFWATGLEAKTDVAFRRMAGGVLPSRGRSKAGNGRGQAPEPPKRYRRLQRNHSITTTRREFAIIGP